MISVLTIINNVNNICKTKIIGHYSLLGIQTPDIRKLKPVLSDCERMVAVDYIMNTLEHSKIRLPFFLYTLYIDLYIRDRICQNLSF